MSENIGTSNELVVKAISDLNPYANNPRLNDEGAKKLAVMIKRLGFRVPVIIKSNGDVIDGHMRLKAAEIAGLESVPCVLADDLSDAQIKELRIAVNKAAELADWDEDLLQKELLELEDMDSDLEELGFTTDELDSILFDEEGDDGESVAGDAEGRSSEGGKEVVSWGNIRLPATEREMAALTAALDEYVEENGSQYGFIGHLLGLS